jgi:hypothetical protein
MAPKPLPCYPYRNPSTSGGDAVKENDWDGVMWMVIIGFVLLALTGTCDNASMRSQGYRPPPSRNGNVPPPSVYE